ncbi:MAG TPA: class I SAM-dependent methyltransferase, partial [Gammaproteobacteria bacterium]|nr:class I SAM-dependent methyltransferase [Gammaproteobacteria bacterium]
MSAIDPYDLFSYESIAFQDTHPRHLACLGRLFELPAAGPGSCRVLELGCATGGNLIPMAWYQPQASFVGVDLSANQIHQGQSLID